MFCTRMQARITLLSVPQSRFWMDLAGDQSVQF